MMFATAMAKRERPGKPQNFLPEQSRAIQEALKRYCDREKIKSTQLGELLQVTQQTASDYLNKPGAGFTFTSANAIAWLLGYEDVVQLLRHYNVLGGPPPMPDEVKVVRGKVKGLNGEADGQLAVGEHPERAHAIRVARQLGVSDVAINAVIERVGDEHHVARWWTTKFSHEQDAIDDHRIREATELEITRRQKKQKKNEKPT